MKRLTVPFFLLTLSLLVASVASAQNLRMREGKRFSIYKETTLAASAEVVTLQQPASGSKDVFVEYIQIYSAVALNVEIERDGTAATGTALTEVSLTPYASASAADSFHTSDVGNGTTITEVDLAAGETVTLDMKGVMLAEGGGTNENLTVRTASGTGDVKITIIWRENP